MRLKIFGGLVIAVSLIGVFLFMNFTEREFEPIEQEEGVIRYLPIGDSYTIGNGVAEADRWPNVLTKHLNEAGVRIQIIGNPAVSGYAVEDALRRELPVVKQMQPDFVTVLIGANDNFRETPVEDYAQELNGFLDELQSLMREPKNIVLVTIPDYSYSPAAQGYAASGISESIKKYNDVIEAEGLKRGLLVADIFPVSQTMTGAEDYISDGLHPSAQGYAKWEKVVYPVVYGFLK